MNSLRIIVQPSSLPNQHGSPDGCLKSRVNAVLVNELQEDWLLSFELCNEDVKVSCKMFTVIIIIHYTALFKEVCQLKFALE